MRVSSFLMGVNTLILSGSALIFGLEKAMFSIAAYFIVAKVVDMVLDGLNRMFAIMIISQQPQAVGAVLMQEGSHHITFIKAIGGYSGEERHIIYCITDRFAYPKLKEMVLRVDPGAILEASLLTETEGLLAHLKPAAASEARQTARLAAHRTLTPTDCPVQLQLNRLALAHGLCHSSGRNAPRRAVPASDHTAHRGACGAGAA